MANLSLVPPPCCFINTLIQCAECGWKACASHWFDLVPGEKTDPEEKDSPIMDQFHVPSKEDTDDVGICLRCNGEDWKYV